MGGQGCAARGDGYGPCVVRRVRYVVPSQVVLEGVGEWPCNQNLLEHLLSYPDLLDLRHFSTRIFHSTALQ